MSITENIKSEIERLQSQTKDITSLLSHEKNTEMRNLLQKEVTDIQEQIRNLEQNLFTIAGDFKDEKKSEKETGVNPNIAILEIREGTGGEEAALFASDLYRMYSRYAQNSGWKVEEISLTQEDLGGIKSVIAEIKGKDAYSLLKNESGVHRVQRVPTTESYGRIHTSTATVAVLPEVSNIQIDMSPNDLKWEFHRSGGHGGQNVNKVSTAVRLIHTPTQTVVDCQEERTQGKNREKALSILRSRLYSRMIAEQKQDISQLRSEQVGGAERSEKIRTYNFPQDRVTDHRLAKSWFNIEKIMNGDIQDILNETLAF